MRLKATVCAGAALVLSALYLAPLARHLDWPGDEDWTTWAFYEVVARKSLVEFGQFPLWNPYACGGEPYHAHPFTRTLAPLTPLHLLLNRPYVSLRLEVWFLVAATAALAYWLARRSKLSSPGAGLAAVICAFAGTVAARVYAGHLGLLALPWVLLALYARVAFSPAKALTIGSASLALGIFVGGNYLVMCALVMLAFEAGWDSLVARRAQPVLLMAASAVLTFALAAVKIVPTLDFLRHTPRLTSGSDPFAPGGPLAALMRPLGEDVSGQVFAWHEYAAYVGWFPLLLVIAGVILEPRRIARPLCLALLLFGIAAGDFLSFAPWALLHRLPLLDSMRIPARFLLVAMIPLGQLAGVGLDALLERVRWKKIWSWLAVGVCFFDLTLAAWPMFARTFVLPTPPFFLRNVPPDGAFHQVRGGTHVMAESAQRNLGTVRCAEGVPIVRSKRLRAPTQRGYRGEAWVMGEGHAQILRFTPNLLDVLVNIPAPQGATLVINQNWNRDWTADTRDPPRNFEGVLSVPLPAGRRIVHLQYRPKFFGSGFGITVIAVAIALVLVFREKRPNAPAG